MREEIAALDVALGPDIDTEDAADARSSNAGRLVSGAVGGVVGLPFRSVIRVLSGAGKRERALREAMLAGMVRRAFLKGVMRGVACAR